MTSRRSLQFPLPSKSASGRSDVVHIANPMTVEQRIARARAQADAGVFQDLVAARTARTGRPRKVPVDAVAAAVLFHAMSSPNKMHIRQVMRAIALLRPFELQRLGFPGGVRPTYRQVLSGVHALIGAATRGAHVRHNHELRADAETGEVFACPLQCPAMRSGLDQVATAIIQTSLPDSALRSTSVALDGTDIESHTTARAKFIDADGRERCPTDPDARWGKRTATPQHPTEMYVGYEAHLATYVPAIGADSIPQLTARLALRPGITDRARAALTLIDLLGNLDEVLLDRGYSTAKALSLARPLRERNIAITMDLHTSQRGTHPGPVAGTLWRDGHLYTSALPPGLVELEPSGPADSAAKKAASRHEFDKRIPFQFTVHSRHDDTRRTQRFKGPALAKHVRCANNPESMRLPYSVPTTTCVQGVPCGCSKVVTIRDTDLERDRQPLPWQSTPWTLSFNRRSLVEGLNAQVKSNNLRISRGFFHMTGLGATTLLLAFTLAGRNTERLHAWYTARGLPEPWQVQLGEPPDVRPLDRHTRTRGYRQRKPD
ncbi:hypothetical protein ASD16_09310 [Cellulomonas sp. Root485]|uniref:hypothetical protein n=1 Tax=Cellulomonas sp. Root485 TaxID=1736546 RepID=UPI0006F4DBAE|nr:hypothetical protein [Cellulomonas sp. Root485]KQY22806.1 hypothetical protein ASD16_09310 [Cellulomonas sp. Root485]